MTRRDLFKTLAALPLAFVPATLRAKWFNGSLAYTETWEEAKFDLTSELTPGVKFDTVDTDGNRRRWTVPDIEWANVDVHPSHLDWGQENANTKPPPGEIETFPRHGDYILTEGGWEQNLWGRSLDRAMAGSVDAIHDVVGKAKEMRAEIEACGNEAEKLRELLRDLQVTDDWQFIGCRYDHGDLAAVYHNGEQIWPQ
jgi:hypothetical protein